MTEPKFKNADGTLTAYALGCGYIDTFTADGKDYYLTDADGVYLAFNGCTYDVHVRNSETFDGVYPRWVDSEYGRHRADWNQFDSLTEARKFWRKIRSDIKRANP